MIARGVYFDDIYSYTDFGLILSQVEIPPAEPKTTFVDVPGRDGALDLTEALGEVKYNDRDIEFVFSILPSETMTWEEKQTQVSNALNGKRCKIILDRDAGYYYSGRCTVSRYEKDRNLKQIAVSARVLPYKYKLLETAASFALTGEEQTVTLVNGRKSVAPTIECTGSAVIGFNGNTYAVNAGTVKILDIRLVEGDNILTLSGSGTIKFTWQEGEL